MQYELKGTGVIIRQDTAGWLAIIDDHKHRISFGTEVPVIHRWLPGGGFLYSVFQRRSGNEKGKKMIAVCTGDGMTMLAWLSGESPGPWKEILASKIVENKIY